MTILITACVCNITEVPLQFHIISASEADINDFEATGVSETDVIFSHV